MGEAAYNLVIVKGRADDISSFKKNAFKNEVNAFNIYKLLPSSDFSDEDFRTYEQNRGDNFYSLEIADIEKKYYGSKWVGAFSILISEKQTELKYLFNSKYRHANLRFLAKKYSQLEIIQIFTEPINNRGGINKFVNGQNDSNTLISFEVVDYEMSSWMHSYFFIEEFYQKTMYLINHKYMLLDIIQDESLNVISNDSEGHNMRRFHIKFYDIVNKEEFKEYNFDAFKNIYECDEKIESQKLSKKIEAAYPLYTSTVLEQLSFVNQYFPKKHKIECVKDILKCITFNSYFSEQNKIIGFHFIYTKMNIPTEILYPYVVWFIEKSKGVAIKHKFKKEFPVDTYQFSNNDISLCRWGYGSHLFEDNPPLALYFLGWKGLEKEQAEIYWQGDYSTPMFLHMPIDNTQKSHKKSNDINDNDELPF